MALIPDYILPSRDDDEGVFSRNINGQLVRLDAATNDDYNKVVKVEVDGRSVQLPVAEPMKDSQGNIVLDMHGRTTPRFTTILDAVVKLNAEWKEGETRVSVPVLCHQPHMTPVAVCRVCMVQVYGKRRGQRVPERKLLPACQHQVKDGMEVFTNNAPGPDGDRVRRAVGVVAELLMCDHLKPAPSNPEELAPFNELQQLADTCGLKRSRFAFSMLAAQDAPSTAAPLRSAKRGLDSSSPVFIVDHSACILCDRCMRACDEVKNNNVIGRTGKGWHASIGFDLNNRMFESSCVQCGECMVSCPTTAITFRPIKQISSKKGPVAEAVPLAELKKDPLFEGVPIKLLLWQKGLVLRRILKAGDVLCRQGEPGHSAFIIKSGTLSIAPPGCEPILRTSRDVIVGEMACLSGMPRTADVSALDDGEIWEVRRNVLDRMIRSPAQRGLFERLYGDNALATALNSSEFFVGLGDDDKQQIVKLLKPKLVFVRVSPGQAIFRQGALADCLYLVRLGHVRVGVSRYGQEATVWYRGPGTVIGEIGLFGLSYKDAGSSVADVENALSATLARATPETLSALVPTGERTATCSALDHVEMARIDRAVFLEMLQQFPALRTNLVTMALNRLKQI